VIECADDPETIARSLKALEQAMTFDRPWAKGFPIAVDSAVRFYYSSAKIREAYFVADVGDRATG